MLSRAGSRFLLLWASGKQQERCFVTVGDELWFFWFCQDHFIFNLDVTGITVRNAKLSNLPLVTLQLLKVNILFYSDRWHLIMLWLSSRANFKWVCLLAIISARSILKMHQCKDRHCIMLLQLLVVYSIDPCEAALQVLHKGAPVKDNCCDFCFWRMFLKAGCIWWPAFPSCHSITLCVECLHLLYYCWKSGLHSELYSVIQNQWFSWWQLNLWQCRKLTTYRSKRTTMCVLLFCKCSP